MRAEWYRSKHPHVCADCGAELFKTRAERCSECAARRERELDRARYARRKAAAEEKKKTVKLAKATPKITVTLKPDRGRDMDKNTFRELKVSKLRADNDRARDAMRKAAAEKKRAEQAEQKRIAAGVAMMKKILARRERERVRREAEVERWSSYERAYRDDWDSYRAV